MPYRGRSKFRKDNFEIATGNHSDRVFARANREVFLLEMKERFKAIEQLRIKNNKIYVIQSDKNQPGKIIKVKNIRRDGMLELEKKLDEIDPRVLLQFVRKKQKKEKDKG